MSRTSSSSWKLVLELSRSESTVTLITSSSSVKASDSDTNQIWRKVFPMRLRNLRYPVHSFSISSSCLGIYRLDFLQQRITQANIQTFYERFYVIICVYFIKRVEGLLKPQADLSRQTLPLMNFAIVVSLAVCIQIDLCPR